MRLDVGRHGHGGAATWHPLPIKNTVTGRWQRCNVTPTGGRQRCREVPSCKTVIPGDDRGANGAVVLRGVTCSRSAIAQACTTRLTGGDGVLGRGVWPGGYVPGTHGDTLGPARAVDAVCAGKPGARNIALAKVGLQTDDCTARYTWTRGGRPSARANGGDEIGERGMVFATSTGRPGQQRLGAAVSRSSPVEHGCVSSPEVGQPSQKPPSDMGCLALMQGGSSVPDGMGWPPECHQLRRDGSPSDCVSTGSCTPGRWTLQAPRLDLQNQLVHLDGGPISAAS